MTFFQIFVGIAVGVIIVAGVFLAVVGALYQTLKLIDRYLPEWCAVVYIFALSISVPAAIIYFAQ